MDRAVTTRPTHDADHPADGAPAAPAVPVRVHSGHPHLTREVERAFAVSEPTGAPALHLVLDAPIGWARGALRELEPERVVVVSDNPCPEYLHDLVEAGPAALLSRAGVDEVREALARVARGEAGHPPTRSVLTPAERETLRLLAMGHDARSVAALRGVSEGTVRNATHMIYVKLGLRSAVQLAHYWFGHWELLEEVHGWRPELLVA